MSIIKRIEPGKNLDPKFRDRCRMIAAWSFQLVLPESLPVYPGTEASRSICRVQLYQSGGQTVYCAAWFNDGQGSLVGYGKAQGYGYDKHSAAVSDAFRRMGIVFEDSFAGRGMPSAVSAIVALLREYYPNGDIILSEMWA